ncbi:uncharacterized protein [Spinacia oleracea]|uniref:Uncharacterized protein n=1 Tax=Spinacia oleracea TaxID=3562 RepID=A0ABM3QT25_SPIOL|nr:uncharacterized protein LOC130462387 [Spinacia oleracea]
MVDGTDGNLSIGAKKDNIVGKRNYQPSYGDYGVGLPQAFSASNILKNLNLKDWDSQNGSQIATELCGFVTILSGTFLLNKTKDMGCTPTAPAVPVTELVRQYSSNCIHKSSKHSNLHGSPDRNCRE